MKTDILRARELLCGSATCVLVKGDAVYMSEKSGIAPMLGFIADRIDLRGFSVADRIVGKAAAMLFVKAGIAEVYAEVLSEGGKRFLESRGVPVSYGVLTGMIINRAGTGSCPMEAAVAGIDDVDKAYAALCEKVAELRRGR